MSNPIYYERNLPHRLPPGAAIFLTFRLAGTLPQVTLDHLQAELELVQQVESLGLEQHYIAQKRYFGRFDKLLARGLRPYMAGAASYRGGGSAVAALFRRQELHAFSLLPDA